MISDVLSLTYNAGKQKYSKFVNISPPSYKSVYIHLYQSKKDGQAHASALPDDSRSFSFLFALF